MHLHVRVLLLRTCENNKIIAQMPELEELYFDRGWHDAYFNDMYDTMRTLVGEAAKLKKIHIRNNCVPFTQFEFANLDRERMKLNGSCKLKIYVDSKENEETGKLDDADRTFNCIEIIRTSSEATSNPHLERLEYMIFRAEREGVSVFGKRDLDGPSNYPMACTPM